jgi:two-component system, LytTR family, sensor histidine kinase AlgZ
MATMRVMSSINQTGAAIRLPNFCNLGVMLRVLLIAIVFCLGAAVIRSRFPADIFEQFLLISALAQPVLILSLLVLCASRPLLHSVSYPASILALLAIEVGLAWIADQALQRLIPDLVAPAFSQTAFFVLFITAVVVFYFDLRSRALSPAVSEARIQALQARIRPHFLYNSINAVLSLIRSDPRRAERALEDLADLFRVLMADNRTLTPISREVELTKQYLAIEELRLGDRLRVSWRIDSMPADALVPPLLLQPLVENAVYHGVEPGTEPGEIVIDITRSGAQMVIRMKNPVGAEGSRHIGNKMAIGNIRERLQLHYDAEATMEAEATDGQYQVSITLPYIKAPA